MKKFGIITFFLAVGVLCVENGWAAKNVKTQETVTVDCIKNVGSKFSTFEGDIDVLKPISTPDLPGKCQEAYPDCDHSCVAHINTGKTLKNKSLNSKTNLNTKNK